MLKNIWGKNKMEDDKRMQKVAGFVGTIGAVFTAGAALFSAIQRSALALDEMDKELTKHEELEAEAEEAKRAEEAKTIDVVAETVTE
jgi:hypothetical protein